MGVVDTPDHWCGRYSPILICIWPPWVSETSIFTCPLVFSSSVNRLLPPLLTWIPEKRTTPHWVTTSGGISPPSVNYKRKIYDGLLPQRNDIIGLESEISVVDFFLFKKISSHLGEACVVITHILYISFFFHSPFGTITWSVGNSHFKYLCRVWSSIVAVPKKPIITQRYCD